LTSNKTDHRYPRRPCSNATSMSSFPAADPHVLRQTASLPERFRAHLARIRFFTAASPRVFRQRAALRKWSHTNITRIGLLSAVRLNVFRQSSVHCERPQTYVSQAYGFSPLWALTCVVKFPICRERFRTHGTRMRLPLRVSHPRAVRQLATASMRERFWRRTVTPTRLWSTAYPLLVHFPRSPARRRFKNHSARTRTSVTSNKITVRHFLAIRKVFEYSESRWSLFSRSFLELTNSTMLRVSYTFFDVKQLQKSKVIKPLFISSLDLLIYNSTCHSVLLLLLFYTRDTDYDNNKKPCSQHYNTICLNISNDYNEYWYERIFFTKWKIYIPQTPLYPIENPKYWS